MKTWTFAEARAKLQVDLDLQDETFITPAELIGYFNEGIEEAESEILKLDEDYFLTSAPLPLVLGTSAYSYPDNLYGFKLRGIMYQNGSSIYEVKRFRRRDKFTNIQLGIFSGAGDDYRWYHTNDSAGNAKINLVPAARETATISPNPTVFTPIMVSYIRHANRVPILGEYVPNYDKLWQATAINTGTGVLTVAQAYVTGDLVKLSSDGTMPGGLVKGTVYYAIYVSATTIKLASSLANALAGTALTISSTGSGILTVQIAANQTIVDNTLLDIPEFVKFVIQVAKVRCMSKEGDPRVAGEVAIMEQQRKQMVETLTEVQQDDNNQVEMDLSSYAEMS